MTQRKITKRAFLVVAVAGAQLCSLLWGVVWFGARLERDLTKFMRDDVLANNKIMAEQVADIIESMGMSDLGYGSKDWQRIQTLVETTKLPNEGFVCVIGSRDGNLLCHPEMRHRPGMASMKPGKAVLHGEASEASIIDAASAPDGTASGWAQMPDGTHLIAVRDLSDLGIKVMAHQRESGLVSAVDRVIGIFRAAGFTVSVAIAAATLLLVSAIVQRYENRLAKTNVNLEHLVERRSRALLKTRDAVVFGLAKLAESRDDDTGQHLERIRTYVEILARELARDNQSIDEAFVNTLGLTSSLHDIGKVGTPDAILLKPSSLTPEERVVIEKHPLIGGDCLMAIKQRLGEDDFLETACEIAFAHHERWDGTGYPFGLARENIPLAARIVALADVYDALTSKRVYKDPMTHDQARAIIVEGDGTHFDPAVVRAFLAREDAFSHVNPDTHTRDEHLGGLDSRLPGQVAQYTPALPSPRSRPVPGNSSSRSRT